ncbi:MAG: hypothetical protein Q9211_000533 [Gyalolechia sp. 1 TL-2023]
MVLLGLALFLRPGAAHPRPKGELPIPALLARPRPLSLPWRRLSARAGGNQVWDTNVSMQKFHFQALAAILPVHHAARELEQFYTDIAQAARGEWASRPRMNGFSFSERGFTLAMHCFGDTIPWDVVSLIADRLWRTASLGMPYLFDLSYSSPSGHIWIQITLRLAAEAIASSVGSSESAQSRWAYDVSGLDNNLVGQPDWREGSVPSVNSGNPLMPGT